MTQLAPPIHSPAGTRRDFLKRSLAGAGAAVAATAGVGSSAFAAEAVERPGKPYMKLSLAGYSFSRQLARGWSQTAPPAGKMLLDDFIKYCAELDLDGCEPTGYYFPNDTDDAYLNHLKNLAFRLGLDISGTAIGNDFCQTDDANLKKEVDLTKMWIDRAAVLGAPVIRIFSGNAKRGQTEEQAFQMAVRGIEQSLEHAEKKGVFLALENHGGLTATADGMLKLIGAVKPTAWFGVNFDSGNFHSADPYAELEKIAPYTFNAQVKVVMHRAGKREDADLGRIVKILNDAGYRGYLVLEYEEREDPKVAVPRYIGELRQLIRRA
ncbi:MAG: sugar phosphate isomerase/epimerase family protein [Planctomycetaceae bacterium]